MQSSEAKFRTVRAARAGDRRAMADLVEDSLPLVYNVVGRAVGGGSDVDDLVQETVLRVLTGLPQLRDADRYRSWLVSIALRQVRDRWRTEQAGPVRVPAEEEMDSALPGTGFEEAAVLRMQLSGQRRETALAMAWLDPGHRETASLWWLELAGELTRDDLAAGLAVPLAHAAVRVQRMREQLDTARTIVALLDRHGRTAPCPELDALLGSWNGRPSPLMRKRLARHLRECAPCGRAAGELLPAEGLLTGLGLVPLPLALYNPKLPAELTDAAAGSVGAPPADPATVTAGDPGGVASALAGPARVRHLRHLGGVAKPAAVAAATVGTAAVVAIAAFAGPTGASPGQVAEARASAPAPAPGPATRLTPTASLVASNSAPPARPSRSAATAPRTPLGDALPARVTGPATVRGPLPRIADDGSPVPSGAVHVSAKAGDGGDGSEGRPYGDLRQALSAAKRGATVVLRGGTYRVGKLAVRKQVTVRSAPGAQVWLKGSEEVRDWSGEDGRWCTPWEHHLTAPAWEKPEEYLDPDSPMASRRDQVYADGSALRQVAGVDDVRAGTFAVDPGGKRLCVGADPSGRTMEATSQRYGLTVWGPATAGTQVRGIGFAHYGDEGLRIGAPRVTVDRVTAVRNGVMGVNLLGDGGPDDVVVRGSNLSFNGRKGMGGGKATNLLLENNLVSYNNTEGFRTAWDAAGIKVTDSAGVTARGNHLLGNYAHALWLDIDVRDAEVTGNRLTANRQFGVFFEISRGAVLAGNVSANNGAGVAVANASGARIVNNTLSGNVTNLLVKENAQRKPQPWEAKTGATFTTRDVSVTNNLFVAPSTDTTKEHLRVQRWPCAVQPRMVSTLDHNAYVDDPAAGSVRLGTFQPAGDSCTALEPGGLDELRGLSYERAGAQVTGEDARDAVASPVRGDFTIPGGSPLGGTGAPLDARTAELIGAPAGRPVDPGAPAGARKDADGGGAPRPQGGQAPTPIAQAPRADGGEPDAGAAKSDAGAGDSKTLSGGDGEVLAVTGAQLWPAAVGVTLLTGGAFLVLSRRRKAAGRHRSA
ncbi:sigma-70 family RNA polymerase sigma factor [Streptomyces sp. NPDC058576]|uniref:sigma-70 family RNA polymerase sigma factor n=1 Tax=Streptomyces sp. NPDC058576 TaxID=3346547 RepID=UPI003652FB50